MGYRFLILVTILLVNGFFAAAEVALVSVRKSRLRTLAEQGNAAARTALNLLANPGRLLSVTQVGVTLASLGLGWAGEGTVYNLFLKLLGSNVSKQWVAVLHGISFAAAFLIISYAHVVIGEVVPKNLALDKADRLATLVAPVLLLFSRLAAPFVWVAEHTTAALCHWLGLRSGQTGGGHSPEEIKFVVSASHGEGYLKKFEQDAIEALLDLREYAAREIMVPRSQIVSVPIDAPVDHVLRVMRENQYSRLPVYKDDREHVIGYVHYKDLMRVWEERRIAHEKKRPLRPFRLQWVLRKPLVVPETKSLTDLIDEFRATHIHVAMVVDEFGTIAGLVTLEDVLEQIFGEIGDEHDVKRPTPKADEPVTELEGGITIRDLASQYGLELPGDAGFETLAGFVLFQLGYIPKPGDSVEHGGRRFTVLEMDRNRIARVRIEKLPEPPLVAQVS
jgi:putative hemolysin